MRSRFLLLVLLLALLPAAISSAQTLESATSAIAVTAPSLDAQAARTIVVTHADPNTSARLVLFDPNGAQAIIPQSTDAQGNFSLTLSAPEGGWTGGVYRVALGLDGGRSLSATFPVNSGSPQLYAGPNLPSPVSAFVFTGTGFQASTTLDLTLTLASGYGARVVHVTTDAQGSFTTFAWPQTFGFPFWSAGPYTLAGDGGTPSVTFWVREHPDTSNLSVQSPAIAGNLSGIVYQHYAPGRYLWTVLADAEGTVLDEYLLGPADAYGAARGAVRFEAPVSGSYLLATPYDWGEAALTLVLPTPTPTNTPAVTPTPTVTVTPTETATATPKPRPTARKKPTIRPTPTARPHATPKKPSASWCKKHRGWKRCKR